MVDMIFTVLTPLKQQHIEQFVAEWDLYPDQCDTRPFNRPFATNDHIVHGGGQAHYYSRTGTSKQRQVKLHWFRSLCFNVPVRE